MFIPFVYRYTSPQPYMVIVLLILEQPFFSTGRLFYERNYETD